jgi:putative acetyltransferase
MTRGGVEIAPLTAALMPELTDLWVGAWTQAMPQIDFEARRPWLKAHLEGLRQQGFVTRCALEATGALLGFVTLQPRSGELDQIAVAPWAGRRGLGRLLLNEARALAPGLITLTVNQDNGQALGFYEREGFVKMGEGVNAMSGLRTWRMAWRASPDI